MTKPTGRPRGRPKTKEYGSITIRMDMTLLERVKRYASLKRQTISEVVRDGVQVLLSDQDPWHPTRPDAQA
jgi:hypothetical protein